jgi:hypothetical protein
MFWKLILQYTSAYGIIPGKIIFCIIRHGTIINKSQSVKIKARFSVEYSTATVFLNAETFLKNLWLMESEN